MSSKFREMEKGCLEDVGNVFQKCSWDRWKGGKFVRIAEPNKAELVARRQRNDLRTLPTMIEFKVLNVFEHDTEGSARVMKKSRNTSTHCQTQEVNFDSHAHGHLEWMEIVD